jgi:uncharacterized membrane protein YGL010W
MKTVEEQLAQYKSVHLNKKNMQSHFIGIPLIILAITLLLSLNRFEISLSDMRLTYTPAMVVFSLALIYYTKLHGKIALGMLLYLAVNLYFAELLITFDKAIYLAIVIFIAGWITQFIGHYYEKAKPAFLDDMVGLLIGPFFLVAEIYFACGFEQKLHDQMTELALQKRKLMEDTKI